MCSSSKVPTKTEAIALDHFTHCLTSAMRTCCPHWPPKVITHLSSQQNTHQLTSALNYCSLDAGTAGYRLGRGAPGQCSFLASILFIRQRLI